MAAARQSSLSWIWRGGIRIDPVMPAWQRIEGFDQTNIPVAEPEAEIARMIRETGTYRVVLQRTARLGLHRARSQHEKRYSEATRQNEPASRTGGNRKANHATMIAIARYESVHRRQIAGALAIAPPRSYLSRHAV